MNAFLFIPLLAGTWALGFMIALFAAHYFLTVLESTASGNEKVIWPEEPFIDWFWKAFYLAFLGGVWLAPMIIIGRLLTPDPWVRFAFAASAFWLLFPIGLLSSQSAPSPWVPFSPGVFPRLKQRMPAVVGFYLVSIPIALALAGSFTLIFARVDVSFGLALALAPVAAGGFLIYARALGRLGLVLSFTKGGDNEKGKSKKNKLKEKPKIGEHDEQPIYQQPSELPAVETPFEGALTGYNVVFDDPPPVEEKPKAGRPIYADEDREPLQLAAEQPDAQTNQKPPPPPEPTASELALWDTSKRVKEPAHPYGRALFNFLGDQRMLSALIILTLGLALLGGMVRALAEVRPG